MIRTSQELPPDVNEFEVAGLTATPSKVVAPPRVAESPVHFECRVTHLLELGQGAAAGRVVIGQVVHIHVADEVLFDGDKIDVQALRPIGRLAGTQYCRVTDLFEMTRPPSMIPKK
jgi:flavin reductase (DIM6/NTAB) family NADH-FMN oxidoreductase RutF